MKTILKYTEKTNLVHFPTHPYESVQAHTIRTNASLIGRSKCSLDVYVFIEFKVYNILDGYLHPANVPLMLSLFLSNWFIRTEIMKIGHNLVQKTVEFFPSTFLE